MVAFVFGPKMAELSLRVQQLIAIRTKLELARQEFSDKHGFAFKRAQNYKNCIVIRWKASRVKYEINYPRIEEFTKISHELANEHDLWIKEYPLIESQLLLCQIGIYSFHEWGHITWAIPNEFKEIQDCVLSRLPKWAKVSVKK